MDQKELSLTHIIQFPHTRTEGSSSNHPTILALHGRGSNEEDLISLAPYLPNDFLWISPRGTFSLGPGSYEWFQVSQIGKPDPARLAKALEAMDRFIDEILASYPVDPNKLYLLGFSQGSVVSLSYTLTKPQRIAGVIAQSGYIPLESGLQVDKAGIKNKSFILTHGRYDSLLPVEWARRSRNTLQAFGADLEYHEFNMGHNITEESLSIISTWLEKQRKK
jgi:phospholipase/carboxylesterase